jgi:hypothetical protein
VLLTVDPRRTGGRAEVLGGGHVGFAGLVLEDDHVALWWKGGATIVLGNAACTSGFSVRNGDNARLLLTAGPCASPTPPASTSARRVPSTVTTTSC